MPTLPTTNAPAAASYAAYLAALHARPRQPEAAILAALAALADVVTTEAATGQPGTGYEADTGHRTKAGQPITASGMKPGTPYARIARKDGRRTEIGILWPCGTLDCGGIAEFTL
jgi:hypothetical protein